MSEIEPAAGGGDASHDRIDLEIEVAASVADTWEVVGEIGWFINDGTLTPHTIEHPDAQHVRVTDPTHGSFTFELEQVRPPHYAAYRGLDPDGNGSSRLVELTVSASDQGATVRVVESGFESMDVSVEDQVAQYEENTATWKHQLELVRAHFASQGRQSTG